VVTAKYRARIHKGACPVFQNKVSSCSLFINKMA
jgi:hypothetical protein